MSKKYQKSRYKTKSSYSLILVLLVYSLLLGCRITAPEETDSAILTTATASTADNTWYLQQILDLEAPTGDGFGRAMVMSEGSILIGSGPLKNWPWILSNRPIAIYLFELDQKQREWTLTKTWFGGYTDIAFNKERIVIGSNGVRLFERSSNGLFEQTLNSLFKQTPQASSGWEQAAELTTNDYQTAVAIDGDTVVIGAYLEGDGNVYIFERNQGGTDNWGLVTRLSAPLAPSTSPYDFGISVAISGDIVVVGARDRIHVFERDYGGTNNWGQVTESTKADPPYGFGEIITIDDDTIVVGFPFNGLGKIIIFERNQDEEQRWETEIVQGDDSLFGQSVAVKGDRLVVGAQDAVYIFERVDHRWQQTAKLLAPDAKAQNSGFGHTVAMGEDTIVVGATGGIYHSGSAYIFARGQNPGPLPSERPPRPDLVVTRIDDHVLKSGRNCMAPPDEYSIAVRIKNIGSAKAEPFEVKMGNWSQMVTSSLEPDQEVTLILPEYGGAIEIDPTFQVKENNEDNNVVSEWDRITPTPPPPCTPTPSPTFTATATPEP